MHLKAIAISSLLVVSTSACSYFLTKSFFDSTISMYEEKLLAKDSQIEYIIQITVQQQLIIQQMEAYIDSKAPEAGCQRL